jgi:serine/threonine protein kinase
MDTCSRYSQQTNYTFEITVARIYRTNIKTATSHGIPLDDVITTLRVNGKEFRAHNKNRFDLVLDLLRKCLALDPKERITAREAMMHPFLLSE